MKSFVMFDIYGTCSVPKPFNKLIYLANKINPFPGFSKTSL